MSLFEDLKNEMIPKVKETFEKGQRFFSSFLNKVDFDITKTIQLLKEKQAQLKQFIQTRETLLKQIEKNQKDVEALREQIKKLNDDSKSEQLDGLRNELNHKLDDLLNNQRKYLELEQRISEEQRKVKQLLEDKQLLEKDRNALKAQYDGVQKTLEENKSKITALENDLLDLREKEKKYELLINNTISKDEIEQYERELTKLKQDYESKIIEQNQLKDENERIKNKHKELELLLLQKISSLSKLTGELNQTNIALENSQKEKDGIQAALKEKETSLKESTQTISKLEKQIFDLKSIERELERKYETAVKEANQVQTLLAVEQEHFLQDMVTYDEKIQELEKQLVDKQNELAIEKAQNGEAYELSEEERKILEREFEPRFSSLYRNCNIHPEFFRDFFHLTPSDRLKAEAAIVQLNYHFEQALSNMRPHPIRTKSETILEYPFGQDRVGRIYFNKKNHVVHLYRLSRTKNGRGRLTQDNVIEWLKINR